MPADHEYSENRRERRAIRKAGLPLTPLPVGVPDAQAAKAPPGRTGRGFGYSGLPFQADQVTVYVAEATSLGSQPLRTEMHLTVIVPALSVNGAE
jgi:hypothetical protein